MTAFLASTRRIALALQRWAAAVTEQQRAVAEASSRADARIADLDKAAAAIRDAERTSHDALVLEEACSAKAREVKDRAAELRARETEVEAVRTSLGKARDAMSAQQVRSLRMTMVRGLLVHIHHSSRQAELEAISRRIDEERGAVERDRAEAGRLREAAEFDAAAAAALRAEQRVAQDALDRRESELQGLASRLATEQAAAARAHAENQMRADELALAEARLASAADRQRSSTQAHEAEMEASLEQLRRARAKLAQTEAEADAVRASALDSAGASQREASIRASELERQAAALQQQAEVLERAEAEVASMRAQLERRTGEGRRAVGSVVYLPDWTTEYVITACNCRRTRRSRAQLCCAF